MAVSLLAGLLGRPRGSRARLPDVLPDRHVARPCALLHHGTGRLLIEQDLGIDGITESVLYAAGVGRPPRGVGGGLGAALGDLEVRAAKMSVELHPPLPADKGTALEALAGGMAAVAYVGDDRGDLPAYDGGDWGSPPT